MIRNRLERAPCWERPAVVIARVEILTGARSLRDEFRKLVGIGLMALFLLQIQLLLVEQIAAGGEALVSHDPPIGTTAGYVSTVVAIAAYSGLHQTARGSRSGAVRPLLSTSTAPRSVALGRTLAEYAELLVLLGGLTAIPLAALGAGAGNPYPPLALVVGALPIAWGGLLAGRLLGIALRWLYHRVPAARAVRIAIVSAATLVAFVWWMRLVETDRVGDVAATAVSTASVGPFRAYVRTLLAPIGVTVTPADVATSLGILVVVLLATAVVLRIETRLDLAEQPDRRTGGTSRGAPAITARRPSLRIGWRYLLLGVRQPSRLSHLLLLVIMLASAGAPALSDPSVAVAYAPELGLVLGTALAGGAFCLNPLGDDRDQHPLLLTATPSLRPVARGRATAGIGLGSVFLLAGQLVGVFDGRVLAPLGFLALAPVCFLASVGVALGFGAAVPSFERSDDRSTIEPANTATIPFLLGAVFVAGVGAWLVLVTVSVAPDPSLVVGWIAYLAVVVGSGALGYRYALGRLGGLTLDSY